MTSHMRTSIIVLCVTFYWIPSQSPRVDQQQRISAFMKGDFIIGALFSIHHQPKQKRAGNTLVCGEVREMYGIQRVEVTFQTLDLINNDPYILPNITLGVEIRDSCWYAPVALQQSIEFIRDAISPARDPLCGATKTTASSTSNPLLETFQPRSAPLVGVVGPGSSSVALQVQNLLQLFHIPQIGYSTTSKDLSDKSRFNYFLRVVPSDYYQAQVMVDIVRKYNWTYVSAVNTDENYGQSGIQAFRELAERASICIAKEDSVLSNAEDEVFDSVLLKLDQDKNARVVVCFCEGMTVRGLLAATQRLNLTGRFLFLGSDGWADRSDVADGYEEAAHGSLSIRIHSPYVRDFDEYYFKLNPFNNSRNPWFKEFWQSRFNCTLPGGGSNDTQKRNCTGMERLNERYKQDPKLSFVIKAIFTLAHGLNHLRQDVCGRGTVGLCPELFPINGALFKSYLLNVSFTLHDGETVEFDRRGDPPGRYNIMNFQQLSNGSYDYIHVGDWNNGTLNVWRDMQLGRKHGPVVESVCSRPCPPGYYKNLQSGGQEQKCCWVCVPCDRNQVLTDDETCSPCPLGWWPSLNKTMCIQIPIEFVKWTDTEALVSIGFSCMGFTVTAIAAAVFIRFNDTPVVKSSTRELSYMILAGMTLSHSATFPILARPSKLSCSLSRTIPGLSFAMIYASLLTKTNRIARILAGSKKRFPTRKPRFMSGTAQVVITCILIGVEAGVAGAMLVLEPAGPTLQFPTIDRAVLVCNTSPQGVVAPLAFDFFLIALCTLYALKTRNVPENFNEAKFIGFAMYTTCVIWIAFVPIYFGSDSKIITTCICITLSAMVTLVFLFLPKLYIILLRPERNNRSFFTTSKEIRCHIGTRVASAISSKSNAYLNSYSSNTESPRTNRTGTSALGDIKPSWQSTEDKLQLSHTDSQNSNIRNERCLTLYRNNVSKQENRLNCNNNVPRHRSISQSRDNDGSWKESQSVAWQPSSVKQEQCREQRSLSIQTGAELLEMLLEGRTLKWAELNPHDLLEATQRPSRSRPHIREESISGDDESGQLKNITIQLGGSSPSITSEYSDYFL